MGTYDWQSGCPGPGHSAPNDRLHAVNTYLRPQQPPAEMSIRTDPPTVSIWLTAAGLTRNGGNTVSSDMPSV
jgi:hypothetical protein